MSSLAARIAVLLLAAATSLSACNGEQQTVGMPAEISPFGVCWHMDLPWSEWDCPDTNANYAFVNPSDVESIAVVIRTKSGATRVTHIPSGADAIFLSRKSNDSIFVRYYRSIGDTTKAQALSTRLKTIP